MWTAWPPASLATLRYVPFDTREARRPGALCCARLTHALPFVGLLRLLIGSRLQRPQRLIVGVYVLYLLPYVVVSYYERYAFPLIGVKIMLAIFGVDRLCWWLFPH